MSLEAVLYTLSSIPMFASRPFLAAFTTALLARFGTSLPGVGDHGVLVALHASPAWFQSPACLSILGLLALAEVLSVKHPEVRQVLDEIDGWVKGAVAALVALAVIDHETARTLDAIERDGLGLASVWGVLVGTLTYLLAGVRRRLMGFLAEVDDDDDLGVQSLVNWVENSWTVLGLSIAVLLPLAAIVLSALVALAIWLAKRRAEAREEDSKVPCAGCATRILPSATACHSCGRLVETPRAIGVFGQAKRTAAPDPARHPFDLVARKRCPRCASRLRERRVRQACGTCGKTTFESEAELERYLAVLAARLPRTLCLCAAFGAIPLVGVIPAAIYYRLNLVAGLRGYIPPLRGCVSKGIVRVLDWGFIALQIVPLLGIVVVPLMCWSTYVIYRGQVAGRARTELSSVRALPERA